MKNAITDTEASKKEFFTQKNTLQVSELNDFFKTIPHLQEDIVAFEEDIKAVRAEMAVQLKL